jgi:hypothetical protein
VCTSSVKRALDVYLPFLELSLTVAVVEAIPSHWFHNIESLDLIP